MTKAIKPIPLNLNKGTCTEQSSNCITWSGPDIPCIGVCKGSCITQVIYDIAINFCNLYQQFDPSNYNLNCLELTSCGDPSFKDLLQELINQVCFLKTTEPFGGCNVLATISANSETEYKVDVEGATLPLEIKWSFQQYGMVGASFVGTTTSDVVNVVFDGALFGESKSKQALLKVAVKDKNGCTATDFMLITKLLG